MSKKAEWDYAEDLFAPINRQPAAPTESFPRRQGGDSPEAGTAPAAYVATAGSNGTAGALVPPSPPGLDTRGGLGEAATPDASAGPPGGVQPASTEEASPANGDAGAGVPEVEHEPDSEDPTQGALFGLDEYDAWRKDWVGMPEFDQEDLTPWKTYHLHFEGPGDFAHFAAAYHREFGQRPTLRAAWWPNAEIGRMSTKRFASVGKPVMPNHPIYIVSKGRWDSRLTSKHLHKLGIPHYVVVEEQEADAYRAALDPTATVVVLDRAYQRDYDTFDDLGDSKSKGPGPARNFAWDHSIANGATWHWVMDDNIDGFFRLYKNIKTPCASPAIFRAMEEFSERYENVGMSGPNYFMFASRKTVMPPMTMNTRIYSCNLIRNDVVWSETGAPMRWRGRYNEDTDISIRMLKDGLCTILFNAFLQLKLTTQTLGGGNTAEFYAKEGTRAKSEMQVAMHPEISQLTEKWGRIHHHVDYSGFRRNQLRLRPGYKPPADPSFGMVIQDLIDDRWVTRQER